MLTVLLGCGELQKKSKYKIGFSQCIGSDQWRITMLKEMRRELSFNPEADFFYEDADGNSEKQIEQVKSLLAKGIDLLIISPNEAQPLTPIVEAAYEKGIPVIVIDRKIASSKYTAYVGADNYEIGTIAGHYLASKLHQKGNVIEVLGLPRSSPAMERERGFADALAKYPAVKIMHQYYGNWLKQDAQQQVATHFDSFAKVDAVFAHNDQMTFGIHQELKKRGLAHLPKLVGVDALAGKNNGLDFVSTKIFDASILYPTGGKEAIRTAFAILKQQPFTKNNILKTLAVDSTNVQLMKMQEEKMDSQQQDIERQQNMLEEQHKIYRGQQFTLNILIVSLVLAVVFGAIAFYSLVENWKNNKRLETQNREIVENEKQLIQMTEKAAAANEEKMRFFTNVSHEFRTPITLMLLSVDELSKDQKLSSESQRKVALVHKNANRILKMVNELLDFRKIDFNKMKLHIARVDMVKTVKEIAQSFTDIATKKHIDLRVKANAKNIWTPLDIQLFDKVLFNILANAFKFTKDYGFIHVQVNQSENELIIEVEDSGVGMSEEDLAHVFEPFYQGNNKQVNSSGLGLALCKEIVELHQGSIVLQSELRRGTVCKISLPLTVNNEIDITDYAVSENIAKTYIANIPVETGMMIEQGEQSSKERSILLMEDNEDMLSFLTEQLGKTYEVFTANNGKDGFKLAIDQVPDLIISDVFMPEADGLATTRRLKEDLRTSHIPVVLLTARSSHEQRLEGLGTMADAYLTKPFNLDVLQATLHSMLTNRELLKQKFTSELPSAGNKELGKIDRKFINDLASMVEANLANENLSVEEISIKIGLSRVQLYRKVKALLNCSVAEYILNRRLQKAKYMLLNEPDLSIAEITFKTGFTSPNYFATVFKANYQCTPSDFRKNA